MKCLHQKKDICLCLFFFLLAHNIIPVEITSDADEYYQQAQQAINNEYYEQAVKTLKEAQKIFPQNSIFHIMLGDLYYDKKLYDLSLVEYINADAIEENEYYTLDQIQRCYGYLNNEQKSIEYLEKILKHYPVASDPWNSDPVEDLAWMYFKTHQLEKGEKIILDTLDLRKPDDRNRGLYMSLGTIYSGMYNYELSKEYYLKAIQMSLEADDYLFSSVAYYNLSLLEHSFYNFNSALQYTNNSIDSRDRATGHLSKGELFQAQMSFHKALSEYELGLVNDNTPLNKINIAILYRIFGFLHEALSGVNEIHNSKDQSWMVNFGTDTNRHKKELHKIFADTYKGLAIQENILPKANLIENGLSLFKVFQYSFMAYYHRQKYKIHTLKAGKEYLKEKNLLDAFWEFYNANEDYKNISSKYLDKAKNIEVKITPHAEVYYMAQEGKINKNAELLYRALNDFNPFWEKEDIAETLKYLITLLPANSIKRRDALNRLYEINPGAFLQYGFGLPMAVELRLYGRQILLKRPIIHFLKKTGSDIIIKQNGKHLDKGYKYLLIVEWHNNLNPGFLFSDSSTDEIIIKKTIESGSGPFDEQAALFVKKLLVDFIYKVE